jgi:hypothetical protein
MEDKIDRNNLHQKLANAIGQHVLPDTNYWGEYEQLNKDSVSKAAGACTQIISTLESEQTKDISIKFAEWIQLEQLTGDWVQHYEYFVKNIYQPEIRVQAIKPEIIMSFRDAK